MKQKITRSQQGWSLDKVSIITTVQKNEINSVEEVKNLSNTPKRGVLIYGMYLEGASWNKNKEMLADPLPRQLYC